MSIGQCYACDLGKSAVGTAQSGAYAIVQPLTQFTTVSSTNNACVLPSSQFQYPGGFFTIRNEGISNLQIFPPVGGTVSSLATNAAYVLPSGYVCVLCSTSSLTWFVQSMSVYNSSSAVGSLTAFATGTQVGATLIPQTQFNSIFTTVATAGDSCALPIAPTLNREYMIVNSGAKAMAVFPGNVSVSNSTINQLAANIPLYLGVNAIMKAIATANVANTITWYATVSQVTSPVIPISAAFTVNSGMNEAVFPLTSAGADYTVTLPAPFQGARFTFPIAATAGTNQVQITSSGANLLGFKTLAGTSTDESTAKTNVFLGNSTGPVASTVGDKIVIASSDGVSYHWNGYGHVAASIRTT